MEPWTKDAFDRLVADFERTGLRDEAVLRTVRRAAARGDYERALDRLVHPDAAWETRRK